MIYSEMHLLSIRIDKLVSFQQMVILATLAKHCRSAVSLDTNYTQNQALERCAQSVIHSSSIAYAVAHIQSHGSYY